MRQPAERPQLKRDPLGRPLTTKMDLWPQLLPFLPVALLTVLLILGARWLRSRPLLDEPSAQGEPKIGPVQRSLAALCGVVCLALGVGLLALFVRSLPHVTLDDLVAAAGAVLFILPAGVVLCVAALKGKGPEPLERWLLRFLGAKGSARDT